LLLLALSPLVIVFLLLVSLAAPKAVSMNNCLTARLMMPNAIKDIIC
jgi:hypothetical protein